MNFELGDKQYDGWDRQDGERIINFELGTSYKLALAGGAKQKTIDYQNELKSNIGQRTTGSGCQRLS